MPSNELSISWIKGQYRVIELKNTNYQIVCSAHLTSHLLNQSQPTVVVPCNLSLGITPLNPDIKLLLSRELIPRIDESSFEILRFLLNASQASLPSFAWITFTLFPAKECLKVKHSKDWIERLVLWAKKLKNMTRLESLKTDAGARSSKSRLPHWSGRTSVIWGVLRRLNLCCWRSHPSAWNLSRLVIGGAEESGRYCGEGDGGAIKEPDLAKLEVLGCRSGLSGSGGLSGKSFPMSVVQLNRAEWRVPYLS